MKECLRISEVIVALNVSPTSTVHIRAPDHMCTFVLLIKCAHEMHQDKLLYPTALSLSINISLYIYLSTYLSIYPSIYLSIYLSIHLYLSLSFLSFSLNLFFSFSLFLSKSPSALAWVAQTSSPNCQKPASMKSISGGYVCRF